MAYYRQLVVVCVKALSNYDSGITGVEEYLERFLKSVECEVYRHVIYVIHNLCGFCM